jgi:hypothetical protein
VGSSTCVRVVKIFPLARGLRALLAIYTDARAYHVPMSNDTKLEAKLHFFNISSFIRLEHYKTRTLRVGVFF